jgi:fructuronate reductase
VRRDEAAPPVRVAHLGLGNFFRAHQAWYTASAPDAGAWGIAAFTGRSRALADRLTAQDGLYTLVVRGPSKDEFEVVGSIAAAYAGTDADAWLATIADPDVAILTLTVTEAGYLRGPDGAVDADDPGVRADLAVLRGETEGAASTVPGRIVAGLAARRSAGAGPIAVVSCDNLPENGAVAARVTTGLATLADPGLAGWITENVSFVTTMVDRITPATTDDDIRSVAAATGRDDAAPVVTEPFSEWVLSGDFPAGRPRWEAAGARFVTDIEPYEQRKLWLLNGGHSLLAYVGGARGHETVAEAVGDPECGRLLALWWGEAAAYLPLAAEETEAYRAALLERWANPRIRHRLAQIASDGSQKLPIRILPVLRLARADGRMPLGAVRILAAWIRHLRGAGVPVADAGAAPFAAAGSARAVLALFGDDLAADEELVAALDAELTAGAEAR